jgi:hypothetical protein
MWKAIFALFGALTLTTACLAGPNIGGVLILTVNESLSYVSGTDYCGLSGIGACLDAVTRTDRNDVRVFHVLAAFPETTEPDVACVAFGITYDSSITIIDHGSCGPHEWPQPGWPASGSGLAVSWDPPFQTVRLFEVCWFAGYVDGGSSGVFQAGPHPNPDIGGIFVGGGPIGDFDPIADYGRLGFGTAGYLPCPDATPVNLESWGGIKAKFRE